LLKKITSLLKRNEEIKKNEQAARGQAEMAILEMLYITKSHLPKEMRGLIVQTMLFIWRDQKKDRIKNFIL